MTYAVLELFSDQAAEDRIGVEGFDSVEALANYVLFAAHQQHPDWRTVRASTINDLREALSMLNTIEAVARFLVGLDYGDDEVRRTLAMQFPGGDVDAAMTQAYEHKARLNADVEQALAGEADAARASEHDLSKSMRSPAGDGESIIAPRGMRDY